MIAPSHRVTCARGLVQEHQHRVRGQGQGNLQDALLAVGSSPANLAAMEVICNSSRTCHAFSTGSVKARKS